MTSGVPWQVKGLRREVIDTAREAARRSGMSVAEWLDTVVSESARDTGIESPRHGRSEVDDDRSPHEWRRRYSDYDDRHRPAPEPDFHEVNSRLDTLSRQIDDLTHASAERARQQAYQRGGHGDDTPRLISEAMSQLDSKIDRLVADGRSANSEIERRVTAIDRAVARIGGGGGGGTGSRGGGSGSGGGPMDPVEQALAEIEARQRALDGEAPPVTPALNLARAPTQRLPDLEQQLRQINARIETMRPCGLDHAVETLRDDLAEIGVMLKDAMPRQAIEALESEVRSLTARIDNKRHAGADGVAIAGVERGLVEVRDALRALTPAESLVGFDETVQGLSQKIDRLAGTGQDAAALKQLEGAIVALRGVVSHVASDGTLAQLSEEVRALSAKVDQVTASDAFSTIERRIASIADALQSRNGSGRDTHDLEAVMHSLSDKIERLHAAPADHGAVGHLEDRIVKLVEKLDASDARFSHLEAIERGLADLLIHIDNQRVAAANGALQSSEASALKHDVQRTQDSLETVHGTLGHVVDRLATIETSIRNSQMPRAENIPEMVPAAPTPSVALALPTPAAPKVPEPAPAPPSAPVSPPATPAAAKPAPATAASSAPAVTANPAPAAERRPIDPNLPPDHPLEPGAARSRSSGSPADRIAASEAALENVRPPVIPDPGGKSNFIAAARRAAQAAIVEAPPPKDKGGGTSTGAVVTSITGKLGGKIRKLMVGAGVALFVLGSLHFVATRIWFSGASTSAPTVTRDDPPSSSSGSEPAAPRTAPDRQSTLLPPGALQPDPLATSTGAQSEAPTTSDPERGATGSIRQPATQAANTPSGAPTPLPPPAPARPTGADRLPPGIGSGGLRAAAVKGDATAEFEIATRFADGRGVPQNLAEAAVWFERAASKELAPAQFRLGGLYEKGMGVRKNIDTARRLYLAAAEAGNAKAMHNLAVLYAEGVDGKPDYQTAARWFRKAADHDVTDSQYNLAILYARGIGVETNLAEAFKWFALASREGDREASRRRDDVAGRLDKQSLTAAMAAAQAWQPQPQPEAAVQVRVPTGGWDGVPTPSTAKRSVGPKFETPTRRPAQ